MTDIKTETLHGIEIRVITLTNGAVMAKLTDLGARLLELHVPDRDGRTADVVLQRPGWETIATDDNYMGATVGRYANRIRDGRTRIDGRPVQLSVNEGANHLHGGASGFDRKVWSTELDPDGHAVTFWRISPAGEEGYPGTLTTRVTYRIEPAALDILIEATTDAPTIANIVNHAYFNLGGHDSGTVLDHVLQVNGSHYTPVTDDLLPTGEIRAVAGTPFDFRTPTPIGKNIAGVGGTGAGRNTESGSGYDHNWVLDGSGMREVLTVTNPASGRRLTMSTNQPGVQLYTGGYLAGVSGKSPADTYPAFAGFTVETQTFPDAPNQAHFPPADARPGQPYRNHQRLEFTTVDSVMETGFRPVKSD
ncbi:aldose epimerase family protein [Actinoplanes sp. NBRC 103695]|uniref:aldose epimerase family protein n=1 Tax=Actinoplanes sp. NBRC 103695 TaxID=3032202 RepID=UPI0024A1F23C|nr:aldose epimerase family protein [Actinoplanes sp. NBRC 103695]GLZ00983.1 aldose 1-epimerase [Actinoplanes sp. NBRC 103695]